MGDHDKPDPGEKDGQVPGPINPETPREPPPGKRGK